MQAVTKGFLLPPRSTSDILSSAFKAGVSLIFDQTSRESLKKLMDKGIINERVLLRADFGLSRMLSLYNDLESPVMKKYGFNVEEFMEGVTPALEQFHNVQRNLTNSLHSIEAEASDSATTTTVSSSSSSSSSSTDEGKESNDADDKEITMSQVAEEQKAALTALTGIPGSNEEMVRLLRSDWKKQAEEKPDSFAGQLYGMTTPEFFDLMQIGNKTSYLVEKNKKVYQDGSGEVHNVCLLSARSMVMVDDEDDANREDKFDVPESELNVAEDMSNADENESASSDQRPVAAQVEVLYTIDEIFTTLEDHEPSSSKDDSENKDIRQTTVAVGVFEGWLNGGPSGGELRWRLSMYRPAWEFNLLD